MSYELVKANLNLYAVLRNLEDLPEYDTDIANEIKDWNISIQFTVMNGPAGYVEFKNGECIFGEGKHSAPSVKLFFTSPAHFNKMMDGNGSPIPLKGFTKLGFLMKDFPKVTDRLEYYLKPDEEKLKDPLYNKINTIFTLNTASFAVKEVALHDKMGKINAAHIMNGKVVIEVLPDGPATYVDFNNGDISVHKGTTDRPMAMMQFKDLKAANELLNNISDPFTAAASGDVLLRGQISMIESINLILDRIPTYLD